MILKTTLTTIGLMALIASVSAQDRELLRLDFDEPQIVLNPFGRSASCDQIRFINQGRELLAVGDDKVVHRWKVDKGLDYQSPLRWNTFRERRGAIYCLDVSRDEKQLVFAGYGRKDADVVIIERMTGRVLAALSTEAYPKYLGRTTVWSVAFDATASRVAVGHEDGSVWLWTPAKKTVVPVAAAIPDPAKIRLREVRTVWTGFVNDDLLYARADGGVFRYNPSTLQQQEIFRYDYPIAQAIAPASRAWLAACPLRMTPKGTQIDLRSLGTGQVLHTIRYGAENDDDRRLPVALATDAEGKRLAIGSWWAAADRESQYSPLRKGDLRLFDLTPGQARQLANVAFDGNGSRPILAPDAIALHPDGETVAVAGGTDHATSLWRRKEATFQLIGEPSVGVGKGVWQVGTRDQGKVIAFRTTPNPTPRNVNDRGTGDWRSFDLERLQWAEKQAPPQEMAIAELNGWRVEINPDRENQWTVHNSNGDFRYTLPFDRNTDGVATSYTFLPGPSPRVTRLAVGTYWGFKLFELRRGFEPRMTHKGVGHQGVVMSIMPTREGQMLITGSSDQTVCVWSLAAWEQHPVLGAKFEWGKDPRSGDSVLQVKAVHSGSPAWEAGIKPGDRVNQIGINGGPMQAPDATTTLDAIAKLEPDQELALYLETPVDKGESVPRGTKTRMLTRPQARLFPTRDNEWIIYKYADYYYNSSTNGDRYMGWLLDGKNAADTPEYHPASRFRTLFHRPAVLQKALADLNQEPSKQLTKTYLPPKVEIASNLNTLSDNQSVTLTIRVQPRADLNDKQVPLEQVELWLDDDVRLKTWIQFPGNELQTTYEIASSRLRVGKNRLNIVATARSRGEAEVVIDNQPKARPKPAIHGLAVGVDQYPYLAANGQLTAAVADARLISEGFLTLEKEKLVRSVQFDLLLNQQATPRAVLNRMSTLAEGLGPDDWVVVFLAGHGFAEPEEVSGSVEQQPGDRSTSNRKRMKPGTWFFCGSPSEAGVVAAGNVATGERQVLDLGRGDLRQLIGKLHSLNCTVSGRDILERLQGLNCRKLILLDSCHSGAIDQDPGRDLRPGDRGAVVISATTPDETATEVQLTVERFGTPIEERHGVFSVAVYHTLSRDREKADLNRDGQLTLEEIHRHIASSVRTLRDDAGLNKPGGRSQTVLASPVDLRSLIFIPTK